MRLSPEWEEHRATLLAWPHREDLWGGHLAKIQETWAKIATLLSEVEQVHILVQDMVSVSAVKEKLSLYSHSEKNIFFHPIPTDDVWIRDYGPLWVAEKRALLFTFDGWGRKYAPSNLDNGSGEKILHSLACRATIQDFILEGGALDTDGHTLLVSLSSILYRQPFYNRREYENKFRQCFGVEDILWLKAGLPGDDTDGHVDMMTRFIAKNKVLTCRCAETHAAYPILSHNYEALLAFVNSKGEGLEIAELPMPPQIYVGGRALPRSYANFYIANQLVLVPIYGENSDQLALSKIQNSFPQHRIEAIDVSLMILEGGGPHCMTMQWPACFS